MFHRAASNLRSGTARFIVTSADPIELLLRGRLPLGSVDVFLKSVSLDVVSVHVAVFEVLLV